MKHGHAKKLITKTAHWRPVAIGHQWAVRRKKQESWWLCQRTHLICRIFGL